MLFTLLLFVPFSLFAQFPYDVIPLTGFNDLILFRDVNENQKWHMKIQGNGALGFTETGVADERMTLNPGGGIGINAIPAFDELFVVKTNSADGIAKIVLNKTGEFRISGESTIDGNFTVNDQSRFLNLVEVFQDQIVYGNSLVGGFLGMSGNLNLSSGYVAEDLGINVHPSTQVTFSVKAQADDTWVIYADDMASDVKFSVQTNGNAFLKGTLTQNSDARLKTKIKPLLNTTESLQNLSGYSYYWKDETSNQGMQIGLIAQEVQKVYPDLVSESPGGTLSVNYSGFVPILLEAIKEQELTIRSQHTTITELTKHVERIERKLDKLADQK